MDTKDEKFIADLTALINAYEEGSPKIVGFSLRMLDMEKKGDRRYEWNGERFYEIETIERP